MTDFLVGIAAAIVLGIGVWLFAGAVLEPPWSQTLALPLAVLAALPVLSCAFGSRLGEMGHSRAWRLLILLPLLTGALAAIAFWVAFYSGQKAAVMLSLMRAQIHARSDSIALQLGLFAIVVVALVALKLARAKRRRNEAQLSA